MSSGETTTCEVPGEGLRSRRATLGAGAIRVDALGERYVEVDEPGLCPECRSSHIVRDDVRGELVCDSCGLVIREVSLEEGPEWSAYTPEEYERLSRVGPPRNALSGSAGLTTVIPAAIRDGRGKTIPARNRQKFYRMRRLQRSLGSWKPGERSLPQMIRTFNRITATLEVPPHVKEEAAVLCRKAMDHGLLHGRSVEAIAAAAVYAACRIDRVPRTLDELAKATQVRRKTVAQTYNALLRAFPMPVPPARAADYVQRFGSELGLSNRVQAESLRILKALEEVGDCPSLSPPGTAAAAIYIASLTCGERRAQRRIAKVAGVSEVTLRNRFECLRPFMEDLELPKGRAPKVPAPPSRELGSPDASAGP